MEQVFRIEIPVEVKSNADLGKMKQIEAVLKQAEQEARKLASSADTAFNRLSSGASNAASAMQQVDNAAKQSANAMEEVGNSADEVGDAAEDAADSMEEVGDAAKEAGNAAESAMNEAAGSADKFSQRMDKSSKTLRDAFKEKLKLTMEAIDKVSPIVKEITTKIKSLAAKAWKITVKMVDFVTAPFKALKNMIMSPITMTLSIAGIGLGAASFYQTFTDFEAGMSNVKALSGATNEEFIKLKDTASELGATTKFTAAEAAEGMQYLAMAGWKTSDIIAGMPGLLQLAAAGGTDLGTAADIVSDVMTAMGMSADQASRAADIFAKTATSTNTTIGMLGETLKYAAPIAHSFGLQLSEVAAVTGMMANAGIKGGSAGTAIRTALLRMASPSKEASKAMSALGLTFSDSSGKMKDMQTIMKDLGKAFGGLSEQEKLAYADDIFGKNASSAWLAVIEQGETAFNSLYEAIDKSEGAAQEMADIQLDNLAGDVTLLQSAVDGMKVSLMDKLDPYLRQGVQWLTAKIPAITEAIGNLVDKGIAKAKELKDQIAGVFSSEEFQNADSLADKFFIAWDKIIAEPFNEWWSGSGRGFVLGIVKKVGSTFGEVLHGIVLGIFAALKGEEIDFEGLNLTGIAKAGAEAAKEYVSSFAQGLNASDLMGSMPGWMTAGLVGFGALKIGSGALGIAKTVGQLRLAFGGVATAATTATAATAATGEAVAAAATTATTGASAFGGLGSALAAIPGWGWAALAALAAVGIGYKLYTDEQARQEEELLHMGDKVEAAGDRYVKAVQRVHDLDTTLEGIQEIKLRVTEEKEQNAEVIAQVKSEIDGILHPEIVLTATLERSGYNTEEAQTILEQVKAATEEKAKLEAELASGQYDTERAKEIEDQIAAADEQIAILTAELVAQGYDEDEVNRIIGQFEAIATKDVALTATLDASGYNILQAGAIIAEMNAVEEGQKQATIIFAADTDMAEQDIATLTTNLTEMMSMKTEKEITLSGVGLSAFQIAWLEGELKTIENRKHEIEIAVAEGEGTPELIAEYDALTTKEQTITYQLKGSKMSDQEAKAMQDQVDKLREAIGSILVTISEDPNSTFTQEDMYALMAFLNTAGEHYWHLGLNLATGSVTTEDLENYNQQLEAYAKHLEEISGGVISFEDAMNGTYTEEQVHQAGAHAKAERDRALDELRQEVFTGRNSEQEQVENRARYEKQIEEAQTGADRMKNAAAEVMALQDAVSGFYQADAANYARTQLNPSDKDYMSKEDYATWWEKNNKSSEWYQQAEKIAGEYGFGGDLATSIGHGAYEEEYWNGALADIYGEKAKLEGDAIKAQEKYDTQNESLLKQYAGERDMRTFEAELGTQYEGKTVEELAGMFGSLDASGLEALGNAVNAIKDLNANTDYISDAEKTTPEALAQTAYESVTAEANQTMLDGMLKGMQQIEQAYNLAKSNDSTWNAAHPDAENPANSAGTYAETQIANINAALSSLGSDVQIDSLENIQQAFDALKDINLDEINFEEAFGDVATVATDVEGLGDKVEDAKTKIEELTGVDLSTLTFDTPAASADSLSSKASTAAANVKKAEDALTSLDGKTATTTIYENTVRTTTTGAAQSAEGGIFNGAFLSWVAEDGPEAIIPLGAKRRERGLDLWMQAGQALGVSEFAEGGILAPYSGVIASLPEEIWDDDGNGSGDPKPVSSTGYSTNGGGNFQVTVSVNPEYSIDGGNGDPDAILDVIRSKQTELAELLGAAMADQLADLLTNM